MKKTTLIPAVAAIFSLSSLAIASGDSPGQRYFSPMLGYVVADDERAADNGGAVQLGIGQVISGAWNVELNISADRLDLTNTAGEYRQRGVGIDGLYFFTRGARFSPYGLVGVGGLRTRVAGNVSTGVMASVGAGIMTDFTDASTALRFEVRNRWNDDNKSVASERGYSDWIVNLGFAIPFGNSGSTATISTTSKDSDGDGVADNVDRCPATPPATHVDTSGCALITDSDGDGINDMHDKCPGTSKGISVHADGCEADSDGDGVVDSRDRCPGTPAGVAVNTTGCEPDSDGDGVVDAGDACLNTGKGDVVDERGCVVIAQRVILKGVLFRNNSVALAVASHAVLDNMADILRKHPNLRIEVAGHTDNTGSAQHNVRLSRQRAEAVRLYLVSQGVDASRIVSKGYGPANPVTNNATDEGRAENRRVELRIIGN